MIRVNNDTYSIEKHPFETFVFPEIKYIIIGTFPTYKDNLRFNFFYSGKENLFWQIIEKVFNYNFTYNENKEAIDERKEFLRNKGIGITDMLEMCYRKNNKSTDENLVPITFKDIFSLLENNILIDRLILTSRTDIFGAWGLLQTYFLQKHHYIPKIKKRQDKILEGTLIFKDRKIKILVPYSPSPRLINNSITTMDELIKMYSSCLR